MSPTSGIDATPSRSRSRDRSPTRTPTAWHLPSRRVPSSWTGPPEQRRTPSPRVVPPPPQRSQCEVVSPSPIRDPPIRRRVAGRRPRPGRPSSWEPSMNQPTCPIATLAWAAMSRRWRRPSDPRRPSRRSRPLLHSWPDARASANRSVGGQPPSRPTGKVIPWRCRRARRPVHLDWPVRPVQRRHAAHRTPLSGASHDGTRRTPRSPRG